MQDEANSLLQGGCLVPLLDMLDAHSLVRLAASGGDWRRLVRQRARALHLQGIPKAGRALAVLPSLINPAEITTLDLEFAQGVEEPALMELLQKAHRLVRLNLNAVKVGDDLVVTIGKSCPQLLSLSLYWNLRVTDKGLDSIAAGCPGLTHLNLSGCKTVTSAGVQAVVNSCRHLVNLDLTRCVALEDRVLRAISEAELQLQVLNLYALPQFSAAALGLLGGAALTSIDMCGSKELNDKGLASISKRSPHLKKLNCTWCVQLTDLGVIALAQNCRTLEYLSLHGILGITDKSIAELAKNVSCSLHTIDITGCVNVASRSPADLKQVLPSLTVFRVHS